MAAYHAVSLFLPLTILAWRNIPSNEKPNLCAALRDAALSALHFHSQRLYPDSNARLIIMNIASVAAGFLCREGEKLRWPISIDPALGSMRMKLATPAALPVFLSTIEKKRSYILDKRRLEDHT